MPLEHQADRSTVKRAVPATRIAASFLARVDPPIVEAILQRAAVHHHPSGNLVVSEGQPHWTGIVLDGMVRVFLTTSAGRQVTLRHARAGGSIGIGALLGQGSVSAQAVTDCIVLSLDTEQVVRLSCDSASLAFAIAQETSLRLLETYREIVIREQGSLRQRLARQLLHLAGEAPGDEPLILPMSHEEIADAVGSAREVVSRHLQRFQAEDMVALERGRVRLVDPLRLDRTAQQLDLTTGRAAPAPGDLPRAKRYATPASPGCDMTARGIRAAASERRVRSE